MRCMNMSALSADACAKSICIYADKPQGCANVHGSAVLIIY